MPAHGDILGALLQARRGGNRVGHEALDTSVLGLNGAYALQHAQGAALGWFDRAVPRTWKSGGGAPDAITHAPLPDSGVVQASAGEPVDARRWPLHQRGIEAEIALRLARDVSPAEAATLTRDGAEALVDALCVSLEVVDSRWQHGWAGTPALLRLADLQSHGALVLGHWQPYTARPVSAWAALAGWVQIGAAPRRDFTGSHPLGDPNAVLPAWLRHVTRDGATAPAGTVVTTGSWCGLPLAEAGDRVEVGFEGVGAWVVQL